MRPTFLKYILVVAFLVFCSAQLLAQETLMVIGNSKGSPSELKMMQLQSILKGEKQRWGDGTKVIIALMKTNTPVGSVTSKKVFNMSGDQLNKYWLALVFQGKADAPTFFNSMNELEAFVVQTPGAIGIIGQSPTIVQKTILVDGKKFL
ncbi:MAG: hypothetical protein JWR18_2338 [Segetibacter sp.]|jgi:hypothetical protein|nr:hypothetical protein [Segetibacter sp.]